MSTAEGSTNTPMRMTAMILIATGALVVVAMRGCRSLQKRAAASAYASYQKAQSDFRDKWQDKRTDLEERRRDLSERIQTIRDDGRKAKKTFREINDSVKALSDELSEVSKDLRTIRADESKERAKLSSGEWRDLRKTYRTRVYGVSGWGYVQQWILLPGVGLLFVGLLMLAKFGTKTESLLAMVMLGVILYSLFVGGELWGDSPLDSAWMFSRGL